MQADLTNFKFSQDFNNNKLRIEIRMTRGETIQNFEDCESIQGRRVASLLPARPLPDETTPPIDVFLGLDELNRRISIQSWQPRCPSEWMSGSIEQNAGYFLKHFRGQWGLRIYDIQRSCSWRPSFDGDRQNRGRPRDDGQLRQMGAAHDGGRTAASDHPVDDDEAANRKRRPVEEVGTHGQIVLGIRACYDFMPPRSRGLVTLKIPGLQMV
jgi:hypothetical protein